MSQVPPLAHWGRGQHSKCRFSLLPVLCSFNKDATIKQLVHASCLSQVFIAEQSGRRAATFLMRRLLRAGRKVKGTGATGGMSRTTRRHTHKVTV